MQHIYELTAPFQDSGLEMVHIRFPGSGKSLGLSGGHSGRSCPDRSGTAARRPAERPVPAAPRPLVNLGDRCLRNS